MLRQSDLSFMVPPGRVCVHGSLTRSCDRCEWLALMREAAEVLEVTAGNIRSVAGHVPHVTPYAVWLERVETTAAALRRVAGA